MSAGYSGTPLARKLGIKAGTRALFLDVPEEILEEIAPLPDDSHDALLSDLDFVLVFYTESKEYREGMPLLKSNLKKDGMIWVAWPKKAAKTTSDMDGNFVRLYGLECGLVDTKVCAFNETWSGMKFMYRKTDR